MGNSLHKSAFRRHHNLLVPAGVAPIAGPVQKGKGKTSGRGHGGAAAPFGGALAFDSTNRSYGAAVSTVGFEGEVYDTAKYYHAPTDNKAMIAPATGPYRLVAFLTQSASHAFSFRRNGADFGGAGYGSSNTVGSDYVNIKSAPIVLATGDKAEVVKATGSVGAGVGFQWFSIEQLPANLRYALVYKGAAQGALAASVNHQVTLQTVVADTDGFYSGAQPTRLTVPEGISRVRVCSSIRMNAAGAGELIVQQRYNGTYTGRAVQDVQHSLDFRACNIVGPPLNVAPGDYFETDVFHDSGTIDLIASVHNWMSIEEVPSAIDVCLAYRSSSYTIPTVGAFFDVPFNAEEYDDNNIHSTVTDPANFVAPAGATHCRVTFNLAKSATTGELIGRAVINGVQAYGCPLADSETNGSDFCNGFGAWVPCSGGDVVKVQAFSSAAGTIDTYGTWAAVEFRFD